MPRNRHKKRQATVYDAVAGRIATNGFISWKPVTAPTRDTLSSSTNPLPAEEVLYKRKNAPMRYAETDTYFANERLGDHQQLPDSDLVKTIHTYTSDFYANNTENQGKHDWTSLDETALLALGIMLEELATASLGSTGDLALTEGENEHEASYPLAWNGIDFVRSVTKKRFKNSDRGHS